MKIGIIGSRNLKINNFDKYLPENITEVVSGGAKGIDTCAKEYAIKNKLKLKEFLPEYNKYGKGAPLKRDNLIIDYADLILAFWDGNSTGTKYVIEQCKLKNKEVRIIETFNTENE